MTNQHIPIGVSRFYIAFVLIFIRVCSFGQSYITGYTTDSSGEVLPGVSIYTSDGLLDTRSDGDGNYILKVSSNTKYTIIYSYTETKIIKEIGPLKERETVKVNIIINTSYMLDGTTKIAERNRNLFLIEVEMKKLEMFPNTQGIEQFLKFIGASGGNELSSGYNVRGGNYDENLVYINDLEVYRPFLVRAGQQEGLSIINPDLVQRLNFSTGGFEARYGDKLSSVLDITYKVPRAFQTSIRGSFLGSDLAMGGISKNKRLSFILGARYRSNRILFNSLDVTGDYKPLNADFQSMVKYRFTSTLSASILTNIAYNRYRLVPESRETSFGTVTSALRLNIAIAGLEEMKYLVAMNGITLHYAPNEKTSIKWLTSYYTTEENEHFTTEGAYGLFELDNNLGSDNLGKEKRQLGYGYFIQNARNDLNAKVFNSGIVGVQKSKRSTWYYGTKFQNERITDKLNEWKYNDSGGHNTTFPRRGGEAIILDERIKANNSINSFRLSSYVQNTYLLNPNNNFTMNAGLRHQYWSYNEQHMISPRVSLSFEPNKSYNDTVLKKTSTLTEYDSLKKRDILFKFASGVYYQPPFYREFRRFDGSLNQNIKAQRSIHFVLGSDLNFIAWGRPFKLINELYYKYLDNLIPYYIDNVRIRYYAENSSKGYATGFDTRVNGEFIKGLESWLSFSLLNTRENISYINERGEMVESGFIRRPTDQRVNFSILFADQLKIDKTYKMHLGLVYGGRVPYYFDGAKRYNKVANTIPPYRRVDIGFSKEIIGEETKKQDKWKHIETLWASVEIFNMLQFNNTISYIWVKDINNITYGVPNYLTGRRLNIRFILKFR